MFKVSPDMSGSGTPLFSIPTGRPTGTVIDEVYTATVTGNIFITYWTGLPLTVFDEVQSDSKFGTIKDDLEIINDEIFVTQQVTQTRQEFLSSRYLSQAGEIVTVGNSSFRVERFPVVAGRKYRIYGTSTAITDAPYAGAIFKVSPDMSGSGTPLILIPFSSPLATVRDFTFNCVTTGNIFVCQWVNFPLTVIEFLNDVSRLSLIEASIESLGSTTLVDAVDHLDVLPVNPLAQIKVTVGMTSIFHSWGFVGDSLTSGEHEHKINGVTNWVDLYDYSWGQQICRACGTEGYNFSVGGQTAKAWNSGTSARAWGGAQTNIKKSYIISLGTNDINRFNNNATGNYPAGNVATDINLTDYNLNADTFAGHLGGTIQRIRSIQPKAKIFLVTMPKSFDPDNTNTNAWNQIIRNMTTKFSNIYIIDVYNYAPLYGAAFRAKYFMGGHMNAAGYQYMANMLMTYIDWIVRKYPADFAQEAFVGTSYTYT